MIDSTALLVGLAIILTALAVHNHFKVYSYWSSRGIPGPTPWPVFGTNIYYALRTKIDVENDWKARYGRTYGVYEGRWPLLLTTDANLIKQIFVQRFTSMTDRNDRFIHADNPKRWIFWTKSDHWANQRVLVSPMFSASKMRHVVPVMASSIDRFIEYVDKKIENALAEQKAPSFDKFDLSSLTLDVISSSFFGLRQDIYQLTSSANEFVLKALEFADFDPLRFILWSILPAKVAAWLKFDFLANIKYKYFDDLSAKIIRERRAKPHESKRNDVIQALIDAKLPDKYEQVFTKLDDKEAHYNADIDHTQLESMQQIQTKQAKRFRNFSEIEIRGQMTFFFIAGFETTASTLSFALYELSHQPDVQKELVTELSKSFGERGEKLEQEDASELYSELLNLKYLDAVVSEVLRLYSPILDHHRKVNDDNGVELEIDATTGKKIRLDKGIPVSTNGFLVQRDPDYFESPNKFDVSRFLPENRGKINTGAFIPFGLGPRHCAGMRFALLEIKLALAKILLRYHIRSNDENVYPPEFRKNFVFLQFKCTNFDLIPRTAH